MILSDEDIISVADIKKEESRFAFERPEIGAVNEEILEQIECNISMNIMGNIRR